MRLDLDLARLGGLFLREGHGQDAVLELGAHIVGIEALGYGEAAGKSAVAAFDAMEAFVLLFLFELSVTGDGEGLVFDVDVDVGGVDFGEVGFEDEFVLGLIDIDGRGPGALGSGFIGKTVEGVLEDAEVNEGVEVGKRH